MMPRGNQRCGWACDWCRAYARTLRCASAPRVRVHRSYIVNLDRIAQIEPLDTGDARIVMDDGATIPCSRRYRDALRPSLRAA